MLKIPGKVVFTGGPSGGKTSIIEVVQRHFGKKVVVVPEAATILYGGGFPRLTGDVSMKHIQRAIYYTVRELEDIVAANSPEASVILCDRGTLDGLAYWPKTGESFFESIGSTLENEYARYSLVLHLRSPKTAEAYQLSKTRIESHRQSLSLDKKMESVWESHKNRFIVEEEPDFLVKVNRVIEILEKEIPKI
ncbi:MAG: ATP-binding protein [Elusimicrobiaceae bacterium]|jgi:nicotinamide riboside kinase